MTVIEKVLDSGFYHEILFTMISYAKNTKEKPRVVSKIMQNKLKTAKDLK